MKKQIIASVTLLALCASTPLVDAQTRRAGQTRTTNRLSATAEANAADNDARPDNGANVSDAPNNPGERRRGDAGRGDAPRPGGNPMGGAFALMGLQIRAYQSTRGEDGKIKVDSFLTEFMKAVNEADADNDGVLSSDELTKLQESMRPQGGTNGGQPGAPDRNRGGRRNERNPRENADSAFNTLSDATLVRAQEQQDGRPDGARPRPNGEQGRRGGAPGGPNGGLDAPSMEPRGFFKVIADSSSEDGSVDLKKLESGLKNALTDADADKDGFLDENEWRSFSGFGGGPGFGGPGFGGPGGGPGFGGAPGGNAPDMRNQFRSMSVSMFLRQVADASKTADGKINIEKFVAEYKKILAEVDANKDGKLNEEEMQKLQEKARESMGAMFGGRGPRGPNGGSGFGAPGQGGPGGPEGSGPGQGGGFFQEARDENGRIDLSKIDDNMPFKKGLTEADTNGDGFIDKDEEEALQNQMRERFQNGRGEPGRNGGGREGGDRPGGNRNNGGRANRNETSSLEMSSNVVVRGQENNERGGDFGRSGGPAGAPGFGRPGGGPNGGPGFGGFGGRPGFGFGGSGFGGGVNSVQTAATKSFTEGGDLVIADFEKALVQALNDADNEDDGLLDSLEQRDAFGAPLVRPDGEENGEGQVPNARRPGRENGDRDQQRGGRNGQGDDQRRGGPNGNDRRNGGGSRPDMQNDDLMRARMIPTPDPNLFVGIAANPSFKFSKPFKKDAGAAEKIAIESDYAMGKYEVRNREYKEFVDDTGRKDLPSAWVGGTYAKGTKNSPVVGVTLKDAEDYCEWLAKKYEGWTFRLPTEAEFENAAAGPKKQAYPWGTTSGYTFAKNKLTTNCQYNAAVVADLIENDESVTIGSDKQKVSALVTISAKGALTKGWRDSKTKTGFTYSKDFAEKAKIGAYLVPVYKFPENRSPYGCIGMVGNAAEWTSTVVDGKNVVRGGSWYSGADECTAVFRGETQDPQKGTPTVGFRVVAERVE